MLNDRVIPFFDSKEIPVLRVLTDRGSEYCGNREHHEYELYSRSGEDGSYKNESKIVLNERNLWRIPKTILSEFYQIAFRKKIYESIEMLQNDLDEWLREYNESRPHSGKYCYGKTPMQTFLDSQPLAKEKMLQYSNNIPNQKEIWQIVRWCRNFYTSPFFSFDIFSFSFFCFFPVYSAWFNFH